MTDDEFYKFKGLVAKLTSGARWLRRKRLAGLDITKDREDFRRLVVDPMLEMWWKFSDEEKDFWIRVYAIVNVFDGQILTNNEEGRNGRMDKVFKRN